MVFRGLGVLFGGKVDASIISTGCSQAVIEADIVVPQSVADNISESGAVLEDGNVAIVARQINDTGRSRSFIGGASVPTAVVTDLGTELVAVHGQSEQLRLTKAAQQRLILDRFSGDNSVLENYQELWDKRNQVLRRIDMLTTDATAREIELDRITRILEQFDELKPEPGEDRALDDEANKLTNVEVLYSASASALTAIAGDDSGDAGAMSGISLARKSLERERHHDSQLAELADRVHELEVLASDVAADISHYVSSVDASPERLAFVEARRSALRNLSREFGDVDALIEWVESARVRQAELSGGDDVVAQLRQELSDLTASLTAQGEKLTKLRTKAAESFASKVSSELEGLAMAGARVEFALEPADLGPFGADVIQLGLISRPNSPWVPINKGASGGELSRIMLAVQVVLAEADPIETFIFDEVDAGVGGAAAVEVGRRLARLARTSQVVVVTHLPQVAAFADNHLVVSRGDEGSIHHSSINQVADSDRVTELARMLAGLADSQAGAQLAAELLEIAESERRHAE
jgi:DNA repair protein RecN (Recombination protein N)